VAAARRRAFNDIEPLAQGRVWMGSQAKARGLVDELGGLDRAIELVKKKAHIPAGERVSLVMYPPRRSLLDIVMRRPQDDILESKLAQAFGRMPYHAWMKGGFLRMMPFSVDVK